MRGIPSGLTASTLVPDTIFQITGSFLVIISLEISAMRPLTMAGLTSSKWNSRIPHFPYQWAISSTTFLPVRPRQRRLFKAGMVQKAQPNGQPRDVYMGRYFLCDFGP